MYLVCLCKLHVVDADQKVFKGVAVKKKIQIRKRANARESEGLPSRKYVL